MISKDVKWDPVSWTLIPNGTSFSRYINNNNNNLMILQFIEYIYIIKLLVMVTSLLVIYLSARIAKDGTEWDGSFTATSTIHVTEFTVLTQSKDSHYRSATVKKCTKLHLPLP